MLFAVVHVFRGTVTFYNVGVLSASRGKDRFRVLLFKCEGLGVENVRFFLGPFLQR